MDPGLALAMGVVVALVSVGLGIVARRLFIDRHSTNRSRSF